MNGTWAVLFDTDGLTPIRVLAHARNIAWVDAGIGSSAQFDFPLSEASDLTDRRFVKFRWKGGYRAGLRLTKETRSVEDGSVWLHFEGDGIQAELLREGAVYPAQYATNGLRRKSGEVRWIGFMDPDYDDSTWHTPTENVRLRDFAGFPNYPQALCAADPNAAWVAWDDGVGTMTLGEQTWFRTLFTVTTAGMHRVLCASDDTSDWWLDGTSLLTMEATLGAESSADVYLETGTHVIATVVTNDTIGDGANESVFSVMTLVADGAGGFKPSAVVTHSGIQTNILAGSEGPPGQTRAAAVLTFIAEAKARALTKPNGIRHLATADFTATLDSVGASWTDVLEASVPVATLGLDEIIPQLAEDAIDFDIDVTTLVPHAWVRRGSDKSTTVAFRLGVDDIESVSTRESVRVTRMLTRLDDGSWVESWNDTMETNYGRIESGQYLGSVRAPVVANGIARAQIDGTATPTATVSSRPVSGAYDVWSNGDSVRITAHRGGAFTKARILGIEVDATGDVVQAHPILVEDPT